MGLLSQEIQTILYDKDPQFAFLKWKKNFQRLKNNSFNYT